MIKTIFENEFVIFEYIDSVLKGTYKKEKVTLEVAKKVVEARLELTKGKPTPLMIAEIGLKQIDREARTYLNSDEAREGVSASALISTSPLTRHLANFFLKITVHKNKLPARVFSNEEEAVTWLKEYVH
ncbi:MAG: hypothetical protein ABJG68_14865 [Crocinitomicaceae bacterium]